MKTTQPKYSFFALFIFVILFIVFTPVLRLVFKSLATEILFTAVFVSATYLLSNNKRFLITGLVLSVPALTLQWLTFFYYSPWVAGSGLFFTAAFVCYIIYVLCRNVYSFERISADLIFGALLIYLLVSLLWSQLYSGLELVQPGSFLLNLRTHEVGIDLFTLKLQKFLYFSLVTLTTLGYGDIIPTTSPAQTLAALEAVTGQFYIAVLVGSLIGLLLRKVKPA